MTSEEIAAGEALRAAKKWRSLTRAMRHGSWFPLVMFGLLTLAAAPLFWITIPRCPNGENACSFVQNRGPLGNPFVQGPVGLGRSEEHTSELQSLRHLVCRLLLEN